MPGPASGRAGRALIEGLLGAGKTVGYGIRYGMTPESYDKWARVMQESGEVPEEFRANPNVADRYLGALAATRYGALPNAAARLGNRFAIGDYLLSPEESELTKRAGRAGALTGEDVDLRGLGRAR